jgi:hypothetical protein
VGSHTHTRRRGVRPQAQARLETERLAGENAHLRAELGATMRKVHDLKAAVHSTAAPEGGVGDDTFSNKKDEDSVVDVEWNMLSGGLQKFHPLEGALKTSPLRCGRAMKKWRIVILRFGTARQNMVLE